MHNSNEFITYRSDSNQFTKTLQQEANIKNIIKCQQENDVIQLNTNRDNNQSQIILKIPTQEEAKNQNNSFKYNSRKEPPPENRIDKRVLMTKILIRFQHFLERLQSRYFKKLNQTQFNMINDWASSFDYYRPKVNRSLSNRLCQFFQNKLIILNKFFSSLNKKYPPIDPGHFICTLFDFLSLSFTLLIIYYYSIQLSFQFNLAESNVFPSIHKCGFIIFILQIVLNLNVGYYDKDEIVKSRAKIFKNYRVTLLEDIVSMLGLIYNFYDMSNSILAYIIEFVFLIKLLPLQKQKMRVKDLITYKYGQPPCYLFFKMVFKVVWYCHWIGKNFFENKSFLHDIFYSALVWHSVNSYEMAYLEENNTWLQQMNISEEPWNVRYIYSLYWACSTIVTGGIMPITYTEIAVSIILIFPTAILFAYIIKEVGYIIDQITKQTKYFEKDLEIMNRYMRSKNVGQILQKRIIYYLEKVYLNKSENTNEKALKILQNFPQNIKEDLNKEICLKILNSNQIFKDNFSTKTIMQCMKIVEEQHFMPGDNIVSMNSHEEICLFLIIQGKVEIGLGMSQPNRDTIFVELSAGHCFGIQSFFSGLAQQYQAKSLSYSSIYKIKRNDFLKMIRNIDTDYENFCMIKDQLITTNMCPKVYDTCKLCGTKNDHNDMICNVVHFHPYKYKLLNIFRRANSGLQTRISFLRKNRKRYHNYLNISRLQKAVEKLYNDDEILNVLEFLYYKDNISSNISLSELHDNFQCNSISIQQIKCVKSETELVPPVIRREQEKTRSNQLQHNKNPNELIDFNDSLSLDQEQDISALNDFIRQNEGQQQRQQQQQLPQRHQSMLQQKVWKLENSLQHIPLAEQNSNRQTITMNQCLQQGQKSRKISLMQRKFSLNKDFVKSNQQLLQEPVHQIKQKKDAQPLQKEECESQLLQEMYANVGGEKEEFNKGLRQWPNILQGSASNIIIQKDTVNSLEHEFQQQLKHQFQQQEPKINSGHQKGQSISLKSQMENDFEQIKEYKTYFPSQNAIVILRLLSMQRQIKLNAQKNQQEKQYQKFKRKTQILSTFIRNKQFNSTKKMTITSNYIPDEN